MAVCSWQAQTRCMFQFGWFRVLRGGPHTLSCLSRVRGATEKTRRGGGGASRDEWTPSALPRYSEMLTANMLTTLRLRVKRRCRAPGLRRVPVQRPALGFGDKRGVFWWNSARFVTGPGKHRGMVTADVCTPGLLTLRLWWVRVRNPLVSRWVFDLAVTRLKVVDKVPFTGHLCGTLGLGSFPIWFRILLHLQRFNFFYSFFLRLYLLKILSVTFRNIVLSTSKC